MIISFVDLTDDFMEYKRRKQYEKVIMTTQCGGELEESWYSENEYGEKYDIVYTLTDKNRKLIDVYTDFTEANTEFEKLVTKEAKKYGKRQSKSK